MKSQKQLVNGRAAFSHPVRKRATGASVPIAVPKLAGVPKYAWLQNKLIEEIRSGSYRVGDRLCTEKELLARYRLSISTVARSLHELESQGYIRRKQGTGTIVNSLNPTVNDAAVSGMATLLVCSAVADATPDFNNVNWFIEHEFFRGLVNTFEGRVRLVKPAELFVQLDVLPPQFRAVVICDSTAELVRRLEREQIPHCIIDRHANSTDSHPNTISLDRMRGIYDGMKYLIKNLGHRDIALVTADASLNFEHEDRIAGYQISLRAFDIPYRPELEIFSPPGGSQEAGEAAIRELLGRRIPFTAIFVDTDTKALGAMKVLKEAGLAVPGDVSVLGFDDVPGVDRADPPLTTIRMPHFECGVEAIRLLDERLRTGKNVPGRVLNTRLVVRQSCGMVRKDL